MNIATAVRLMSLLVLVALLVQTRAASERLATEHRKSAEGRRAEAQLVRESPRWVALRDSLRVVERRDSLHFDAVTRQGALASVARRVSVALDGLTVDAPVWTIPAESTSFGATDIRLSFECVIDAPDLGILLAAIHAVRPPVRLERFQFQKELGSADSMDLRRVTATLAARVRWSGRSG